MDPWLRLPQNRRPMNSVWLCVVLGMMALAFIDWSVLRNTRAAVQVIATD